MNYVALINALPDVRCQTCAARRALPDVRCQTCADSLIRLSYLMSIIWVSRFGKQPLRSINAVFLLNL
jgi:hypothetical protein